MYRNTKVATCCYCGTRAALVLDGRRHELACAGCGAPLHDLKALPVRPGASGPARRPPATPARDPGAAPAAKRRPLPPGRADPPPRPRKRRRKSLLRRAVAEALDLIEDILD